MRSSNTPVITASNAACAGRSAQAENVKLVMQQNSIDCRMRVAASAF
jgi:hypothetical protein